MIKEAAGELMNEEKELGLEGNQQWGGKNSGSSLQVWSTGGFQVGVRWFQKEEEKRAECTSY